MHAPQSQSLCLLHFFGAQYSPAHSRSGGQPARGEPAQRRQVALEQAIEGARVAGADQVEQNEGRLDVDLQIVEGAGDGPGVHGVLESPLS